MDDQSLERWRDAVRRTKKALADADPEAVRSLLEQLAGVQGALGKLAEGTVSRSSLAEAVGEALRRLLREDRAGLLPELDELLARVEASENVGGQLQDLRQELSLLVEKLRRDLHRHIEARVEGRDASLAQKLDDLKVMVGSLPTLIPARDVLQKLAGRLDRLQREIEQKVQRARGELSAQAEANEQLRADLERAQSRTDEGVQRLEARVETLSGELREALDAIGRLRGELAERPSVPDPEEDSRRRAERREREVLRRLALDLRDVLREGLLSVEDRPPRSIRDLLRIPRRQPAGASAGPGESRESFRYRLEIALEALERLLAEGDVEQREDP